MDEIEFSVERELHLPIGEWTVLDIRINGHRLQAMAKEVETRASSSLNGPRVPGDYMGLDPRDAPTLLGHENPARTTVLRCTCGDLGCGPLTVDVDTTDHRVTWSSVRSANPDWDLSSMGPFVFDRDQYEHALQRAAAG